ncbi:protein of unknown function DUF4789 [Trinorchestia longiramus]|nr:protein of unknown function DUF4789 [Trinorchestia longiramus]
MQAPQHVTPQPLLSTTSSSYGFSASVSHGAPEAFTELPFNREALLHFTFPTQEDTLAYVDALKHSDLSQWRSLEEVAARAGRGSCSGTMSTSVLTALYLLGLFHLCTTSPTSCCIPPAPSRRRRHAVASLPPVLDVLQQNLSSTTSNSERWPPYASLPQLYSPERGVVPVHLGVVEQVRQLWNSNPRLLSSVPCRNPTESVRSSFISLSGVASGIILAYSVAQLKQCYPNFSSSAPDTTPNIWFFPLPKPEEKTERKFLVPSLPSVIPVPGDDDPSDGCERSEVVLEDGRCAPLLSTLHCPYQHWVLLNRDTRKGECVPRLCGEGRVYVERDQLCHDVNEHGICAESQRLFLDAFGRSVCDCPDGMYQGPDGQCFILYDPAYCAQGTVLQFHQASKTLMCGNDPCGHVNSNLWPDDLPFAPREDGFCYQFNEQGPCEAGERFGFNTETLRAECVSLFEAGMLRPKRSYLYSQMSYPSSSNHPSQHYQVSYVVVNGSTWGLEVKGVDRERRRPREVKDEDPTVKKLPFIDTWSIPSKLEAVLSHLYSSEENVTDDGAENCDGHFDESAYEDCEYALEAVAYEDESPEGFLNDPKYLIEVRESQFTNTWDDPVHAAKVTNSQHEEIISNEVTLDQSVTTPLSEKLKKKQLVQALIRFSNEGEPTTLPHTPSMLNSSEMSILNPSLNADALFAPVGVTTSTEEPENSSLSSSSTSYYYDPSTAESIIKRLLTPRLRIIDTLSHPRRQKPERKISQTVTLNSRLFNISNTVEDNVRNGLSFNLGKVVPEVNAGEVLKVNQDEEQVTTQLESSEVTTTSPNFRLSSTVGIVKVDQSQPATPEDSTDSPWGDRPSTPPTTRVTVMHTATTRRRGDITVVTRRSHRRPHRRRRNRRRKFKHRKHRSDTRKDKNRKRHNRRKNPNLPTKVPVSVNLQQEKTSTDASTSKPTLQQTTLELAPSLESLSIPVVVESTTLTHTTTDSNKGSSIKHLNALPVKPNSTVSSTTLVTEELQASTTPLPSKKSKRPSHASRRNRLRNRHRNATSRRPGRRRPSFSLTDQRHRDRRQLTAGGGIIQAPLLSACKPGAKRDYNYKCRPKFIPQEKNTEDSQKKQSAVPVPPRIKCPKGTHLDPRGKCQAISNILG